MADTLQQLLRTRSEQDSVAVRHDDRTWTWREHVTTAGAQAAAVIAASDPSKPMPVGVRPTRSSSAN